MSEPSVAVLYCLHDDHWFLEASMRSWAPGGKLIAFVSKRAWDGSEGNYEGCVEIANAAGAELQVGEWLSEADHRAAATSYAAGQGFTYALIPDGDEVIEPGLLDALLKVSTADLADRVYVHWDTYWKSCEYVIRPRERFTPLELIKLDEVRHVHLRHYEGGRALVLGPEHGLVHHLSYAGPEARIERKLATWGHRSEVVRGWYERVWKGWDRDKLMRSLHPTHPEAYGFTERIQVPSMLKEVQPEPSEETPRPNGRATKLKRPSKVSVVIPLHGGEKDIRNCLQSLERCGEVLTEVVVVDNASPDGAAEIAEGFKVARVVRMGSNLGFAPACNRGIQESSGDIVVLLNSDTVVPRSGLERLIETVRSSGSVGAAGPLTNEAGYDQRIEPTYTSLENLDLFAEDFAARQATDYEAPKDMLVGFCLAVKRSVLEEVGDLDESFGLGTFEDNDLCYRIRRAGYRLMISAQSFVHHEGSATLSRVVADPRQLLESNRAVYEKKWREDLSSGYASHLPGLVAGRVVFDPEKHPDLRRAQIRELALQADISLCMIVRNEQRVLMECLESAKPFFSQMIVVDTGSTDRTIEIAKEAGAEVYEMEWPDSFSLARNESLKHATGKWIFWMDADDTLPWECGDELLRCALSAPEEITAFVVPVQFVEEGPGAGTRVDHVKLFRNGRGIHFEGRIHEQNLPSISATGGKVARSSAFVLHSGYDTSPEGQAKKRVRDEKLLKLDLEERPDHPFVLFNLGMTAHYCKDHEEACKWLQRSIDAATPNESHVRKAYALLAVSKREMGYDAEALSTLLRGLDAVGEDPELHFQAGLALADMERYSEARKHYEAIGDEIGDHFSSLDVAILGFKRHHNLASVCAAMRDYESAKRWWLQALQSAPQFLPSAFALFDAAIGAGDLETARRMHKHVLTIAGPSEDWVAIGVKLAMVAGGESHADAFLIRAISEYPTALAPQLALARRLLQQGQEVEAVPYLRRLSEAGIAEAAFYLGVGATRMGDYPSALAWMERALELDPAHSQTREQVEQLKTVLLSGQL